MFLSIISLAQIALAEYDYGVTIDAGSTGSRVYVYKWEHRADLDATVAIPPFSAPISETDWSKKVNIPLASFASNPDGAGQSVGDLVKFASDVLLKYGVQVADQGRYPIFLGATAGMRVIPITQRTAIMDSVRNFLASDACPFAFELSYARVISGEEEGVFGWLSVNFMLGNLKKGSAINTSVGALDMGGASTQITFASQGDILADLFPVRLGELSQIVYTHSYLSFGSNEAKRRLQQSAVDQSPPGTTNVINPCLPTGYIEYFIAQSGVNITMVGASDLVNCGVLATQLIEKNMTCWTDTCGAAGEYQPPLDQKMTFYAFSGFGNVIGSIGVGNTSSIRELQTRASQLCAMNWVELQKELPAPAIQSYIKDYCFQINYYTALLGLGYGFDVDSTKIVYGLTVHSVHDGKDSEIGWALGNMVYQSNLLPWDLEETPAGNGHKVAIGVLAGLLGLALLALLYMAYRAHSIK